MLNEISAYCSIVGFVISIFTFGYAVFIERKLQNFKKTILFKNRISSLLDDLAKNHSILNVSLASRNERKIKEALFHCATIIEDINLKLSGDSKKQGIKIWKILNRQYSSFRIKRANHTKWSFFSNDSTLDDIYNSYNYLNSFMIKINYLKQDNETI